MRTTLLFFLAITGLTSALFLGVDRHLDQRRSRVMRTQAHIIETEVHERLRLFLDRSHSARILATFWQQVSVNDREYELLASRVVETFPEVLGFNQVDLDGRIVRVHPYETNRSALGKTSQNIAALRASLARGETSWFSHPFDLYQGKRGFVGYAPLFRGKTHLGWLGVVITTDSFRDHFTKTELGRSFRIEVNDVETGASYFRVTGPPARGEPLHEATLSEFGRQVRVRIWRKARVSPGPPGWVVPVGLAVVFGFLATLAFVWWHGRHRALQRLAELNHLLELAMRETNQGLAALQAKISLMKSDPKLITPARLSRKVAYLSELVGQMLLLRDLALQSEWRGEKVPLLPAVLEVTEAWADRLRSKDLFFHYDPEELSPVRIVAHRGLFTHALLANLLGLASTGAAAGTSITLTYKAVDGGHRLELSSAGADPAGRSAREDYALAMARKVAQLHGGTLAVQHDSATLRFTVWLPDRAS